MKRAAPKSIRSHLLTAVGKDGLSQGLIDSLGEENIEADLVYRHPSRGLGIYVVKNDPNGERSFVYWRNDSAAKETMRLIRDDPARLLKKEIDLFFFSGISVAILDPESRGLLWKLLGKLKEAGCEIAFDPNYRPLLWVSADETRTCFERAIQLSDIVLPGIEDFTALYGFDSYAELGSFIQSFAVDKEVVIKNGNNGVHYMKGGESCFVPVNPVKNVVDTTAAGDSFNGSYLAKKALGVPPEQAIKFAAEVAALVIQHKGAVVDKQIYSENITG